MQVAGFSLNTYLFLDCPAIGIVVDDAIVVVENVERKIEDVASPRKPLTRRWMKSHPFDIYCAGAGGSLCPHCILGRDQWAILPTVRSDAFGVYRHIPRCFAHTEPGHVRPAAPSEAGSDRSTSSYW
jgi:hypothetical protein